MNKMIPLCKPDLGYSDTSHEVRDIKRILRSGILTGGEYTKKFEEEFAKHVGVKYCIAVNSCASALQLAIEANILYHSYHYLLIPDKKGKIIVPSFSFVASANVIQTTGNQPIFSDIYEDTLNIDVHSIPKKYLKDCAGIMPVDIAGLQHNKKEVTEFAMENDLFIIEDSAEMIKKDQGTFGTTCFSFFVTKNMTTGGEGGMIATNSEQIASYCRLMRAHGVVKRNFYKRDCVLPGYNFRMTEIQAAIGLAQLKNLDKMTEKRRNVALQYNLRLRKFHWIKTLNINVEDSTWQMYIIRVPAEIRDKFVNFMREQGIECSVHFDPILSKTTYFRTNQSLPIAEKVSKEVVTLPIFPDLRRAEIDFIVEKIEEFEKKEIGTTKND